MGTHRKRGRRTRRTRKSRTRRKGEPRRHGNTGSRRRERLRSSARREGNGSCRWWRQRSRRRREEGGDNRRPDQMGRRQRRLRVSRPQFRVGNGRGRRECCSPTQLGPGARHCGRVGACWRTGNRFIGSLLAKPISRSVKPALMEAGKEEGAAVRGWSGGEPAVGSVTPLIVLSIRALGTRSERGGTTSILCPGTRVGNQRYFRQATSAARPPPCRWNSTQ